MITEKILATKTKDNTEFSLVKIINDANEMYQFKINSIVCWFFKSKEEMEDGSFKKETLPFGIDSASHMIALEKLIEFFKVA